MSKCLDSWFSVFQCIKHRYKHQTREISKLFKDQTRYTHLEMDFSRRAALSVACCGPVLNFHCLADSYRPDYDPCKPSTDIPSGQYYKSRNQSSKLTKGVLVLNKDGIPVHPQRLNGAQRFNLSYQTLNHDNESTIAVYADVPCVSSWRDNCCEVVL